MVDLGFVEGLFRVRLFWCSFKVFRFVEVLVDGLKHCKFRRISLRHAPKVDFWHRLRYAQKCHKTQVISMFCMHRNNAADCSHSPARNSVDFRQTSAPSDTDKYNMYVCKYVYIYIYQRNCQSICQKICQEIGQDISQYVRMNVTVNA